MHESRRDFLILYAHHETMLMGVVKMSDHPDIHGKEQLALWIYFQVQKTLNHLHI